MKKLFYLAVILLSSCIKDSSHSCPFDHCPYKGYGSFPGVIHTGDTRVSHELEGSDIWAIDKLHFKYPSAPYDELEERLFNY